MDLGCGPGVFTLPMAEITGSSGKVIAVDVQEKMLEKVKKKAISAGLCERIIFHRSSFEKIYR